MKKTAKEYNNKYANKLKNWTTYNFIPIIIIVYDKKGKQTQTLITIQLNEKIYSAKEKFYKIIGHREYNQWLYAADVLPDSRTFENYDIEHLDEIEAHPASRGG